jgi:hypothetical protein
MEENADGIINYWANLIADMVTNGATFGELKTAILYSSYDIRDKKISEKAQEFNRKYGKHND